jgi:hypothetical protein
MKPMMTHVVVGFLVVVVVVFDLIVVVIAVVAFVVVVGVVVVVGLVVVVGVVAVVGVVVVVFDGLVVVFTVVVVTVPQIRTKRRLMQVVASTDGRVTARSSASTSTSAAGVLTLKQCSALALIRNKIHSNLP